MEQALHKRAKTTYLIRQEIKTSKLSIKVLAKKYGISISTVHKWITREDVRDKPMGNGRSNSILTKEEEEIICEARRKTWLPLRVSIRSSKTCYGKS